MGGVALHIYMPNAISPWYAPKDQLGRVFCMLICYHTAVDI